MSRRAFCTAKKPAIPKFFQTYKKLFTDSKALEMVVPPALNSIEEYKQCGLVISNTDSFASKLPKGTQAIDLEGYKR